MNWKKERDLLIAQTMAFVQSVTGKTPDLELAPDPKPDAETPLARAEEILTAAPAAAAAPQPIVVADPVASEPLPTAPLEIRPAVQTPRAFAMGDVRSEMQARVANFRAHQERFSREREEYFSATLTRLRASIDTLPKPSDRTPSDR